MMFGGFRVQYTFSNMESIAMLNENSYKIDQKIGKVVSIARGCFQGPGYMSKKVNLDVSDERISEKSEKK